MTTSGTSRSRTNLAEEIIDLVTTRGKLAIDAKTSETELAELLGFPDRTPILRETLALLARDGIIVQKPKVGHWIRRVSLNEGREIISVRAGVEKLVPAEFVLREDADKRLASVRAVLPELEKSMYNPAAFVRADGHFRYAVAAAAGLLTGTQAIRSWSDRLRIFRVDRPFTLAQQESMLASHQRLILSLEKRDASLAAALVDSEADSALAELK